MIPALWIALALGAEHPRADVMRAVDRACRGKDERCTLDATLWAKHESDLQPRPKPFSWDAKAGVSCGLLQSPCATLPDTLEREVQVWLTLRRYSLETYGDLRALAGATPAGEKIARARAEEADAVLAHLNTWWSLFAWCAPSGIR